MKRSLIALVTSFVLYVPLTRAAAPLGTAFTYQGQLKANGAPATGSFNMTFALFDAAIGGLQVGPLLTFDGLGGHPAPVSVQSGLFNVVLDFGAGVFTGNARWIETTVSGTLLTPRQPLTPAPNALYATSVPWAGVLNAPSSLPPTGVAGGDLAGAYPNPVIGSNAVGSTKLVSDPSSLSKVSAGALYTDGTFVGIGSTAAIGSANFVLGQNTSSFGGMYVNTLANGEPFYGYARGGLASAYHYVDGSDAAKWKLFNGGVRLTVTTSGDVGIATTVPTAKLDVRGDTGVNGIYARANGASGLTDVARSAVCGDTNIGNGILGTSSSVDGVGVLGKAMHTGVRGESTTTNGIGVFGKNLNGYGGYFAGNVQVVGGNLDVDGTISKGGGSFKIDHPLDPANKYLYHSFVESPDMKNIYDGVVTTDAQGLATITMPDWFDALNQDFRYQLTIIDENNTADFTQAKIVQEVRGNQFSIRTSRGGTKISWQVTGVRHDPFANAHRIPVEENKPTADRGLYLHPTERGMSMEQSVHHRHLSPSAVDEVPNTSRE